MNDQVITELERQCQQQPEDLALRFRWYQALIRAGRATERALLLAANHGDEAAQWGLKTWRDQFFKTHEDLRELAQLPIRSLFCAWDYQPEDRDLDLLQRLPLTKLYWTQLHPCPENPNPLKKLKSKAFESLKICGLNLDEADFKALNLSRLRELRVTRNNRFSGDCLKVLQASPLEHLQVYAGSLRNQDLQELKDLPLKSLELLNLSITDTGLRPLTALRLEKLVLYCEQVRGTCFNFLDLSRLQSLEFGDNSLENRALQSLGKAPLKELTLSGMKRLPNDLSELSPCPIETLSVTYCNVRHRTLSVMQAWPLKRIELHDCQLLNDKTFAYLKNHQIEELDLVHSHITGSGLRYLRNSPLRSLKLREFRSLNGVHLKSLKDCPIEILSIRGTKKIAAKDLAFLKDLPLKELHLGLGIHGSPKVLSALKNKLLTKLSFIATPNVSDSTLQGLQGQSMEQFSIRHSRLKGEGLNFLSEAPLKTLEASFCPNWDGRGLDSLQTRQLNQLDITRCPNIEDKAFEAISSLSPSVIRVEGAPKLTNKVFDILKTMDFEQINFMNCPGLNQDACDRAFGSRSHRVSVS